MIDSVIAGTGDSRYLRTSLPASTTWEDALAMLRAGTFPIDLAGINLDGFVTLGTALNSDSLLKSAIITALDLDADATPSDAWEAVLALIGEKADADAVVTGLSYDGATKTLSATINGTSVTVATFNFTTPQEAADAAPVQSVAGKTGDVTLTKSDVGLGNVDNTSDADKPISTATQEALNAKQNTLTFDTTPTSGSTNPVTSGGVYTAESQLKSAIYKYDDLLRVIKITDATTTMGDVQTTLDTVNTAGDHVVFDVSALDAGMYLCTIYINQGYYRIADLVTGFEGTGFFSTSDLLKNIIKSGSQSSGTHYTVRWDKTNAQMTRLNDAASITTDVTNFAHRGAVNENYDNPFDGIYPWSERKLCNIDMDAYRALTAGESLTDCVVAWEDDADFSYGHENGVWVYTPPFYGRSYSLGNYVYFDVTDENLLNNVYYPAQITGRWHGVKVTLTIDDASKSCLLPKPGMPCKREAVSTIKSYANNWGASLVSIYELDASLLLYLVEFVNYNAQLAVGNGVSGLYRQSSDHIAAAATNSSVVQVVNNSTNVGVCIPGAIFDIGTANGGNQVGSYIIQSVAPDSTDSSLLNLTLDRETTVTTDNFWSVNGLSNVADEAIGSKSGYIGTNGKSNAYYRGEVLWGNLWQYILGAYHQATTNLIWLAKDANDADNYNAINTAEHINTGIAISATNGYINALAFPEERLSAPAFCTAVGGSSTAPVGDYFYNAPTSNTILLVGGNASYGTPGGPFYWYWASGSGTSAWTCGGRPRLKSP